MAGAGDPTGARSDAAPVVSPPRGIPGAIHRGARALDAITTVMAYVAGVVLVGVAFYITVDVLSRRVLGVSSAVTDEIGGYALALTGMWALAYALHSGAHVRIDVLIPYLPPRVRIALNYLAMLTMAGFATVLAAYAWRLALDSLATAAKALSPLQTPLFWPQSLIALGLSALAVQAAAIVLLGLTDSVVEGRLADLRDGAGASEAG